MSELGLMCIDIPDQPRQHQWGDSVREFLVEWERFKQTQTVYKQFLRDKATP